jgi:hypothetical protein
LRDASTRSLQLMSWRRGCATDTTLKVAHSSRFYVPYFPLCLPHKGSTPARGTYAHLRHAHIQLPALVPPTPRVQQHACHTSSAGGTRAAADLVCALLAARTAAAASRQRRRVGPKGQRVAVHAVPAARRLRAVLEHVAEVALAPVAAHLSARREEDGVVWHLVDGVR